MDLKKILAGKVPAQEFAATFCEQLGTCSAGARINSSACHPYRKSHLPLADALRSLLPFAASRI